MVVSENNVERRTSDTFVKTGSRQARRQQEVTKAANTALAAATEGNASSWSGFFEILFTLWTTFVATLQEKREARYHDAEDAVADAFAKLWENVVAGTVGPQESWFGHLYEDACTHLRRMWRQARLRVPKRMPSIATLWDAVPDKDAMLGPLKRRLKRLSALQRKVVIARLRGLPHDRIASVLGITPDTSRAVLTHALRKLRGAA